MKRSTTDKSNHDDTKRHKMGDQETRKSRTSTYYQLVINDVQDDYKRREIGGLVTKPTKCRNECVRRALVYALQYYNDKVEDIGYESDDDYDDEHPELNELSKIIARKKDCNCSDDECLCQIPPEKRNSEELLEKLWDATYKGEDVMITWDYSIKQWEL